MCFGGRTVILQTRHDIYYVKETYGPFIAKTSIVDLWQKKKSIVDQSFMTSCVWTKYAFNDAHGMGQRNVKRGEGLKVLKNIMWIMLKKNHIHKLGSIILLTEHTLESKLALPLVYLFLSGRQWNSVHTSPNVYAKVFVLCKFFTNLVGRRVSEGKVCLYLFGKKWQS